MNRWRILAVLSGGLILFLTLLIAARLPVAAAPAMIITRTVMLEPVRDTTLYQSETGAIGNGAGQYLFAGRTDSGSIRRALLAFDLGDIPPGATVLSATLTLTMSKSIAGETPVALHVATADWGEGASDAAGEEGGGAIAAPGDATWLHTFFDTALWAAPGGDFDPAPSATTPVGAVGVYTWKSRALVMDVAAWLADPATNHGWALLGDETANTTAKRFDSRENDPANRPRLTIIYSAEAETTFTALLPAVLGETGK